ncbi:MAG TPA: isocitrate/isopropylmalate family dehydrogenase, partial [Pyrinomonadaceae bacterium]|nr:isocitrate/isopropylmalate family dehydrogenase [Pyrinomonadaceae bacterium]
ANPIGAILTAAMMLEYLEFTAAGEAVERAVRACVTGGETTRDLGGTLSTAEAGDAIRRRIRTLS